MPETPVKIWGSTVTFNGNLIGRIKSIGEVGESRTIHEFLTCDSTTEDMEFLTAGKNPGELSLVMMFEPSNIGNYEKLKTDYDADTSAAATITLYTGGAQYTGTARVTQLGTPAGEAAGLFEFNCTLKFSGAITYTSD